MAWREIIYQYDGNFEGLLCCVFESYTKKNAPPRSCTMGTKNRHYLRSARS